MFFQRTVSLVLVLVAASAVTASAKSSSYTVSQSTLRASVAVAPQIADQIAQLFKLEAQSVEATPLLLAGLKKTRFSRFSRGGRVIRNSISGFRQSRTPQINRRTTADKGGVGTKASPRTS
jgi:hypothetical protein